MPTSSARPERLVQLAAYIDSRAGRLQGDLDEVITALGNYRARCPDGPPLGQPGAVTGHAIAQARRLAARVGRVAVAFNVADSGGGTTFATANDHALSQLFAASATSRSVPAALLVPQRYETGGKLGRRLAHGSAADTAATLAGWATAPPDGAYAAGVLDALNAPGLLAIVSRLEMAYGNPGLGRTQIEAALGGLAEAVRAAGSGLSPLPLQGPLRPERRGRPSTATTPYALDLTIIERLGATMAGREALRQITLGIHDLHPAVTAALAGALLDPLPGPPDATIASRALIDRSRWRGLPDHLDIPILRLLAADRRAGALWELGSPPGQSRLAMNFRRRTNVELAPMADLAYKLWVSPVLEDGQRAWQQRVAGTNRTPAQAHTDQALTELLDAISGLENPPPNLARLLAALTLVHPAFFEHRVSERAFRSLDPDPALIGWFEVLSRHPMAIDDAVGAILARGRATARECLAGNGPGSRPGEGPTDALRACLQPVRDLGLLLVRGALRAGRSYDLFTSMAINVFGSGINLGIAVGSKATGPAAPVIALAGRAAVVAGTEKALERMAWSSSHLERKPAKALDRSIAFIAARAMAADADWRPHLRRTADLATLDVVGSDADWQDFRAWIARQEPVVRDTLDTLRL